MSNTLLKRCPPQSSGKKATGQKLIVARKDYKIQPPKYALSLQKFLHQIHRFARPVATIEAVYPLVENIQYATVNNDQKIHQPVISLPLDNDCIATTTIFSHIPQPSPATSSSHVPLSDHQDLLNMCFWFPHRSSSLRNQAEALTNGIWREYTSKHTNEVSPCCVATKCGECKSLGEQIEPETSSSHTSTGAETSSSETTIISCLSSPLDAETARIFNLSMHIAPSCENVQERMFGSWINDNNLDGLDGRSDKKTMNLLEGNVAICDGEKDLSMTDTVGTNGSDIRDDKAKLQQAEVQVAMEPLLKLLITRVRTHSQTLLQGCGESECVSDRIREGDSEEIRMLKDKLRSLRQHAVLTCARKAQVDVHIDRMHAYNEAKDIAQALFGEISKVRGCTVRDVHEEYGLDIED